jgi:hypothetical protein
MNMGIKPLSKEFLLNRGFCCNNGCLNCPYKTKPMANQFFYTRKELVSGTPENPEFKEYRDSFNVNKVIRSLTIDDGRVLVLIDDIHERVQETPDINPTTGKVKGTKRERNVFQSEIYLTPEDGIRFYQETAIK